VPALVDTGALELLRRRDERMEALVLRNYPPVLCAHVAGEFIHCQLQARVSQPAVLQARTFVAAFEVLAPTARTADHYAELRTRLAVQGLALPDLSCWIAAHALEQDVPLITTDRAFRRLPGLKVHFLAPTGKPAAARAGTTGKPPKAGKTPLSASALAFLGLYLTQDLLVDAAAVWETLGSTAAGLF